MIQTTNDIVFKILRNNPATRNSDSLLYSEVVQMINPMVNNMTFGHVMANMHVLGIPTTETVRRARQKLQAAHPELAANSNVQRIRSDLEHEYRSYAVGGV